MTSRNFSGRPGRSIATEHPDYRYLRHLAARGTGWIHPQGKHATRRLIHALELAGGEHVLEIGCGTGATLVEIARRYPAVRLEGVDLLPEMVNAARTRLRWAGTGGTVRVLRGLGEALPFRTELYDRLYLESVLGIQSTFHALSMLREAHRVLRPGGLLVANEGVWRPEVEAEDVRAINTRCLRRFGLRQASPEPWSAEDWLERMREAGFRVESAALLADVGGGPLEPGSRWAAAASSSYTAWLRLRALSSSRQREERRRFDAHLEAVEGQGQAIEARMFVLRKVSPCS